MALFDGTNLGLIQRPGEFGLKATELAQNQRVIDLKRDAFRLELMKLRQEEQEKELLTDATMDILEGLKGAGDFQAKMDVLNSPAAHKMWAHPKGRMIMEGISRNVANEQLVRSRLENTKLGVEKAETARKLAQIGGLSDDDIQAGVGTPTYDAGAKRVRERDAAMIASSMGVTLTDQDMALIPAKPGNGMLDSELFISWMKGRTSLDVSTTLGPEGEVMRTTVKPPGSGADDGFAETRVVEVDGSKYVQVAGGKTLHKIEDETGKTGPLTLDPVMDAEGNVIPGLYRIPGTTVVKDTLSELEKLKRSEGIGNAARSPAAAPSNPVVDAFKNWSKGK